MAALEWLIHETGLYSLYCAGNRDIYLILFTRFLRMFAYGGVALVTAIFLWTIGEKDRIGSFLSLTLLGDAFISYVLTLIADRFGRRRILFIGSLLMVMSGTVFIFSRNYWILLLAAIVGVLGPGGHEVGPFRAIEESVLAHLTPLEARTDIYAWFAVASTLGMAFGLAAAGWTTWLLSHKFGWDWKTTYPVIFGIYAGIGLVKAFITLFLTEACETEYVPVDETSGDLSNPSERVTLLGTTQQHHHHNSRSHTTKKQQATSTIRRIRRTVSLPTRVAPESRPILLKLSLLFAINAFATGMLPTTLMAWYANYRFKYFLVNRLGYAMCAVWLATSLSNLASASIARRFGLVPTMIITHLPSAVFLAFLPLASTWYVMLILLLLVSAFGATDQAPRAAFVAASFRKNERTTVIGTINLVSTVARAAGPWVSTYFWQQKKWWPVFVIAASVKVVYDLGLAWLFLRTTLPEERMVRATKGMETGTLMGEVRVSEVDVGTLLGEGLLVGIRTDGGASGLPDPREFDEDGEDDDGFEDGEGGGDGGEGSSSGDEEMARRGAGGGRRSYSSLGQGQAHGAVTYTA